MASVNRLGPFGLPLNRTPGIRLACICFSHPIDWNPGLEVEITLIGVLQIYPQPAASPGTVLSIISVFTGS